MGLITRGAALQIAAAHNASLDETGTVYVPNPGTGDFDQVAEGGTNLKCRLATVQRRDRGNVERTEFSGTRALAYHTSYTAMPNTAQVLISGVRWNVEHDTQEWETAAGIALFRRVTVVRAPA